MESHLKKAEKERENTQKKDSWTIMKAKAEIDKIN